MIPTAAKKWPIWKDGRIAYKHIGALTHKALERTIVG
jgi:hypothetical protein